MSLRYSTSARNVQADALTARLDNGYLRIFSGSIPSSANESPPLGSRVLVELHFGAPAFLPAEDGVATAYPLYSGEIEASGVATWFRTYEVDSETIVFDGTVGEDLLLEDDNLRFGGTLVLREFTYGMPEGEEVLS